MPTVNKIDSNVVGLRYQEELVGSIGVADTNNDWVPLEPNSFDSFGGEFTTVARNPINASRQRSKGVLVDLDASGGYNSDLTQRGAQDILQGFMFADYRRKAEAGNDSQPNGTDDFTITSIGASNDITVDSRVAVSAAVVAGGTGYAVGDVVQVTDANATVNARFIVTAVSGGVVTAVALTLTGFTGGVEGRTHTDTGVGAATTVISGSGDAALTLTVTYGNGLVWQAGDMIWSSGHNNTANDGLKTVASVANNVVTVDQTLVADASPASTASIVTVGFEGAAGDIDVDASGTLPTLTSTALDFTTLGLIPGEWIFIGGDLAANAFTTTDASSNSVNNGWVRVNTVAANVLTLDKTQFTMVTEASTTEEIRLFFGRVLKNESDPTLQKRRTYQLERTLGAPDATLPAQIQAEYLEGAVPSEFTLNFATADKVTYDASFVATETSTKTGAEALKSGTRPAIVASDAFNTSNDMSKLKLSVLDRTAGSNPSALFAFVTEFTLNVNNNLSPNKAISVLGAFDVTAGQFIVDGSMTAFFADVAAVASIRNNDDITLDFAIAKGASGAKFGVAVDVPLITLGDGKLAIEQDAPITLPLDTPAAADAVFDHTLLFSFFDLLPDRADTA